MDKLILGMRKMKLVYYYPMTEGSPSNVSRKLLEELLKHIDLLPFSEIIIFTKRRDVGRVKELFPNLLVISHKELNEISEDYLVHFPMLPLILPNSKFLLYLRTKFISRKKIIIQYHGDLRNEFKSNYKDLFSLIYVPSYILVPNILKSANRVITHSYYMNRIIEKYGVSRSVVIPNSIDSYWFQPNNDNSCLSDIIDENKFNIFYHGRFSWEKGVDLLLTAAENHIKNNPDTIIYLAGDGPQRKYLKELGSKLDIDRNVVFLGHLNREHIKSFLKKVDLAIYPSRFDNFPLAVLEALSCATCPVYFSQNMGIYDFAIRDGVQLSFFELNSENLTKILSSVGKKKKDVIYQVEFAKKYSWDLVISKYINLYNSVLDS